MRSREQALTAAMGAINIGLRKFVVMELRIALGSTCIECLPDSFMSDANPWVFHPALVVEKDVFQEL